MADTTIDCSDFLRNKIDSMLVTTHWVDDVKALLGIEGISQIWGDVPAWYFWISDSQGVYQLQLSETLVGENHPETIRGLFSLKCYPYIEEDIFQRFSFPERQLRKSRFFDSTHTPVFEEKDNIPESFYNVAAIEFETRPDNAYARFTLEALSSMRVVFETESIQEYDFIKQSKQYKKGETDRSVPGLSLGYPFFDRLVSLYSYYSKMKPNRIRFTRTPGFKHVYSCDGGMECIDSVNDNCYSASVFFTPTTEHRHHPNSRIDRLDIPDAAEPHLTILFDQQFPCGHFHGADTMATAKLPDILSINKHWWSLAEAEYKSGLTTSCGCS